MTSQQHSPPLIHENTVNRESFESQDPQQSLLFLCLAPSCMAPVGGRNGTEVCIGTILIAMTSLNQVINAKSFFWLEVKVPSLNQVGSYEETLECNHRCVTSKQKFPYIVADQFAFVLHLSCLRTSTILGLRYYKAITMEEERAKDLQFWRPIILAIFNLNLVILKIINYSYVYCFS